MDRSLVMNHSARYNNPVMSSDCETWSQKFWMKPSRMRSSVATLSAAACGAAPL